SRPKTVAEITSRLGNSACDEKEKSALRALISQMVGRFRDKSRPSYYVEASRLSRATTQRQYHYLAQVFSRAIVDNAEKGNALDGDLLPSFVFLLWNKPEGYSRDGLYAAVNALRERLDYKIRENALEAQYLLCYTLGVLLDVAVDIKASEIDKDSLRDPLLKLLADLKDHDEPRLAQAAAYAYEALRGISDNQGPWDIFWSNSWRVIAVAARTAGAVSTMNPERLLEAGPDLMELLEFLKKIYDAGKDLVEAIKEMDEVFVENIRRLPNQRLWYGILRYTSMLIMTGGNSFDTLEHILPKVPCGDSWQFWCGLYAQLEQGFLLGGQREKNRIIRVVNVTFDMKSLQEIKAKSLRVQQWINLISETFDQKGWKQSLPRARRSFPFRFLKKLECEPQVRKPFDPNTAAAIGGSLLEDAWHECKEAQRFYADAALTEYYLQQNRLKILRLSNDTLDIESCYINLGIVKHSLDRQNQEAFELPLQRRLKVEAPGEGEALELQELFDARKLRSHVGSPDVQSRAPRRILIRGRAGVGKTTLCKKIVHDFINANFPRWKFERVLWIPLRKLKDKPTLDQFLCHEIWSNHREKNHFISALLGTIYDQTDNQTLLLLDGFDEIVGAKTPSGDLVKSQPMLDLLNYPNVIITSRPHAAFDKSIQDFDLELETTGFRSEQVEAYVDQIVGCIGKDERSAKEIKHFINSHWLMKSLLQIPIQLDALCFAWNERLLSQNIRTMTSLYQAIEVRLWKKDMVLMGKLSESEADNIYVRSQVEQAMHDHIELIQKLAFTGLYNNIFEFTHRHRITTYATLPGLEGKSDNLLNEVSFLRSSHPAENHQRHTYYFLHLTFQEFFAAHYFVHCWMTDTPLICLELDSTECHHLDAKQFIHREKYNGRYNVLWRFVAGLLFESKNQEKLTRFMQVLNSEPRDLLVLAHPRILMYCFNEILLRPGYSALQQLQHSIDGELLAALVGYNLHDSFRLSIEMEFPEHLLGRILDNSGDKLSMRTLRDISRRAWVSPALLQKMDDILHTSESKGLKQITFHALGSEESLPIDILDTLAFRMRNDKDAIVKIRAMEVWSKHCVSPADIVETVVPFLDDGNSWTFRLAAAEVIGRQKIPDSRMRYFVSMLNNTDSEKRQIVLRILLKFSAHSQLPDDAFEALLKIWSHVEDFEGESERFPAQDILLNYHDLSDNVLKSLIPFLDHANNSTKHLALKALSKDPELPEGILESVVQTLATVQDDTGKYYAVNCLRAQKHLSPGLVQATISVLTWSTASEVESIIRERDEFSTVLPNL
ncbi:NACHT domain-containing protein, partial [Aspergillus aculeatinus CBS 121060]